MAFPGGSVDREPAIQEMWVGSVGQEDPERIASSILGKFPWTKLCKRSTVHRAAKESYTTEATEQTCCHTHAFM